ncbi:MAG: hypothetical protein KME05_13750 [Gloeocapsa sp. UFS-A4-WI-NPMV-4B04]|jgi:hypothetical protein|nr:hypothetical protein [Gloeocapsa sp. UFS-A4-WI-NPMV-4B04]
MYDRIQHLPPKSFKRKCGVRRETFEKMVEILKPKLTRKGKRGGQSKFGVEDQLLIAMEYWREYRTQFHIGQRHYSCRGVDILTSAWKNSSINCIKRSHDYTITALS